MRRTAEARAWQTVGIIVGIAGFGLLAYEFAAKGFAAVDWRSLRDGIAASFLILAGTACVLAGRSMYVEETKLTSTESTLWKTLAFVSMVGGVALIGWTWSQHHLFAIDRLIMGLAGGFGLMFGTLCLLGQRVMAHMHDLVNAPTHSANN